MTMVRNLQITIHEAPPYGRPGSTAPYLPGRPGFGPGDPGMPTESMTDPSNPGMPTESMTDPSNPGMPTESMTDPSNPQGTLPYPYGYASAPLVTAFETTGCPPPVCCCGSAETKKAPDRPGVAPRDYSGFVIVRTAAGVPLTYESLWQLATANQLSALQAVLEIELGEPAPAAGGTGGSQPGLRRLPPVEPAGVLVSRPLIALEQPRGAAGLSRADSILAIEALEGRAAASTYPPLHSLAAYWRVDLRPYPDRVEEVVDRLNALAEVDLAYRELTAVDPTHGAHYADDQAYLADAPVGISAAWAMLKLPKKTLLLCDLEQEWNLNHDDLEGTLSDTDLVFGDNRVHEGATGFHGTAVLGQLVPSGATVQGAAAGVADFFLASHYRSVAADPKVTFPGTNGHVAAAIVNALITAGKLSPRHLDAGDVLLLEVQRGLRPTEIDAADFEAIRLASGLGVIVVEPAGNGGFDLDRYVDPDTGASLRRGAAGFLDSGAIVVGAARSALPHDRAGFSNFGSRVDCFAWGDSVTSCGYGNLAGQDFNAYSDYYTNTFGGTSSASPIIAAAAALVQALHVEAAGFRLDSRAMRVVLADLATGTRQGPNVGGAIGVMPDLRQIVRGRLQLVPDVYLRRRLGDGGAQPYAGDEISSSPDIILYDAGVTDPVTDFGEGPSANVQAPGIAFDPATPRSIYKATSNLVVRLRNRGGAAADEKTEVHLFASPAATLITPERWWPIGEAISVTGIAQGDLLTVGNPLIKVDVTPADATLGSLIQQGPNPGDAASIWQNGLPPFSFLAVQLPTTGTQHVLGSASLLPPGPPYFDWAAYRRFLRGPGVAWRNVYSIVVGSGVSSPLSMAFLIAGTPDQGRYFDLEVLQRLPAGVKVTLRVPSALTAKLRQRQPWLVAAGSDLVLPTRSRTTIGPVKLAGGTCIPAAFEIAGAGPLKLGHSLAIRQLWNGEEVGRITWWFVEK
jgi:serine protease